MSILFTKRHPTTVFKFKITIIELCIYFLFKLYQLDFSTVQHWSLDTISYNLKCVLDIKLFSKLNNVQSAFCIKSTPSP